MFLSWLFDIFEWYGRSPIAAAMNGSVWAFPIVESLHMMGIVLLVGTAVILDLRLMGLRLTATPASTLASALAPWTSAGLLVMLITGPLILATDADRYYSSSAFRFKMSCLLLGIVVHFVLARKAGTITSQRVVGALSLLLWTCVVSAGRFIGVFA